jgi:hypothetical protein
LGGLKGAAVLLIAKKILDLLEAKIDSRSIIRLSVTKAEKPLTLSRSIKKLQHFEIKFDGKYQGKIVIFGNFPMSPSCHGNRKFKTEHVVTKAMVQSTFIPSLISIEAFFIVS